MFTVDVKQQYNQRSIERQMLNAISGTFSTYLQLGSDRNTNTW